MRSTSRRTARRAVATAGRRAAKAPAHTATTAREASEQLHLAQQALGIVTWIWDPVTERAQWYGDASPLLGLAPGTYSGAFRDYLMRVHPDDRVKARAVFVDCLKGRLPEYRTAERVVWPDGSVRWLETYGRADYGADGHTVRMTGVIKDITERKQQESARLKAEKQLARFFDASPEYIVVVRAEDGQFVAANPAFERITGYRHDEIIGRTVDQLGIWALPNERARFLAELLPTGKVRDRPVQLRARDGRVVHGVMWSSIIEHEGETLIISLMRDLSEEQRLERMANQSERKFSALFDSSPVAMLVTKPGERRVVDINDAALRLLGITRAQAIGRRTDEIAQPLDWSAVERVRTRALAGERVADLIWFRRLDGSLIEVFLTAAVVELDGEPHFTVSALDVTEQRRIEHERQKADARYRSLFGAALDGFFITTPDHVVVDVNPAACKMTGYAREELIGQHASRLFSSEELAARPLRGHDLIQRWSLMERELSARGSRLAVEVMAGPLPDGNALAVMRDITERKRNDTLLMNVARGVSAELGGAFFRSLVEHLARELGADFAFIGELVEPANDRVRTLACVVDGAVGDNFEYRIDGSPCLNAMEKKGTVIYPQGVAELFPRDTGLRQRGIEAYVGTSLHAADGSALGVLVVMHRKPVERGVFWASMIEIFGARAAAEIERARAEALVRKTNASLETVVQERTVQLEEVNRELESYNYSISHDLRQPLNAISGFAELLRGADAAHAEEFVREIEQNAARMEEMIAALLALSQAGRESLDMQEVDARVLVDSVLHDLGSGGPIRAALDIGDLPPARGDAVLLRQVWQNVIGNALKYSARSAAPRVEIRGERRNGMVEYLVRDNGIGFDMREAGRLFEAFQRLPSASGFSGSGIGLAIVQRIVRRHGGSIRAESEPGRGATFRFTVPA
jgi:PAS domain S-box-containing protein